jgi:hypothetical protein
VEFEDVMNRAGWRLRRTLSTGTPDALHVLEADPSTAHAGVPDGEHAAGSSTRHGP